MAEDDLLRLIAWFDREGYPETADLARLLRGTGLRVNVEALSRTALTLIEGAEYDTLRVIGKGGHERTVPLVDPAVRELLRDPVRLKAMRGITSKLPSPHSVRHYYATRALSKSGGNLVMVQELLGHASPTVTSRYLTVNVADKARALMEAVDNECK
jgi:integrase/recombinase XerD